tara:strand:+ start:61 stop:717 length:657 start_codon:yes stop_codon:yes gene_type:complete
LSAANPHHDKDGLDTILKLAVAGILISFVIAISFYKLIFSGDLSSSSNDWSALGSFFGGIFGPLVAFVTLIALLKTIRLQRKLLETQRGEFQKLLTLQSQTFDTQNKQLLHAEQSANQNYVLHYKSTLLRMLEQQISLHQSTIERCAKSAGDLLEWLAIKRPGATAEQLDQLLKQKENSEKSINKLSSFAMELSLKEYQDIEHLKKDIAKGLSEALAH